MATPDIDPGAVLTALLDHARLLGQFEQSRITEYKTPPPNGLCFAVWAETLGSAPEGSGLASTNALVVCMARIYYPAFGKDEALHEVRMLTAAAGYLGRLGEDLTLAGLVRNWDVLGQSGELPQWTFGHASIDNKISRIGDLSIRLILNDVWAQGV